MGMILDTIKYCYEQQCLVSVFANEENTGDFLVGYVSAYSDSKLLISHITPNGYYDGYILKRLSDIWRIEHGNAYENKIEKLYQLRQQSHKAYESKETGLLWATLDFARRNRFVISLELEQDTVSGFVNEYDQEDGIVQIAVLDSFGTKNGTSIIMIEEILTVAVDSDNEQNLNLLAGNQ